MQVLHFHIWQLSSVNKVTATKKDSLNLNIAVSCEGKRYFNHSKLADIICTYPFKSGLSDEKYTEETERREVFLDFLMGVLVSYISQCSNAQIPFSVSYCTTFGRPQDNFLVALQDQS